MVSYLYARIPLILQSKMPTSNLKQCIADHYAGLQSDELMSDLVNLFTASKGGRTLWERLKTRMGSGRRSRRNDRKVMERVFTPKDAVRLILDLKIPEK